MQFLMYGIEPIEPTDAQSAPLSPEQLAALAQLTEDMFKAGVLVVTGAAAPTGKRIKSSGGNFTTTDGPFIEAKELTGGFAIIQADSVEEAIELAKRFRLIIGDGESEIVQIYGPGDFRAPQ